MVFNQLNAVIGISQNIVDSLQRAGVERSIVTFLPPVMDVRRFDPNVSTQAAARQKIGLPQAEPIILYIGNLTATKGIDILLNAVPLILSQKPSCRFVFTFDLDLKDSASERKRKIEVLRRIKELGLQDHIKCMGVVHDIPRLLIAADVVVAPFLSTIGPSDYPLVLLEAMAVGRAVVSTSVGGIPEIIDQGQTGVLVSPGDAQELAEAVVNLLSDSDHRHQIGQSAASFLRQTFDARVVTPQYEQLYAKLVQERRR
jgi:glycosyltransferase involved in cell wall biosynthesis